MAKELESLSIELIVNKAFAKSLSDFIDKHIPTEYFFRYQRFSWINGNVANNAHMTLAYGLIPSEKFSIHDLKVKEILGTNFEIENISFFDGYENGYYVVYILPKINESVNDLVFQIRNMGEFLPNSLEFKPHITLCYIKVGTDINIHIIIERLKSAIGEKFVFDELAINKI